MSFPQYGLLKKIRPLNFDQQRERGGAAVFQYPYCRKLRSVVRHSIQKPVSNEPRY